MNAIEQVQSRALTFPEQAKQIIVKDPQTLSSANQFFLDIRALRKEIASVFDPMENAAKEAKRKAEESRREIVRQREKIEEPLLLAESYLNGQITHYKTEQDRKREEEQERLRQEAIKAEMERRKIEEEERLAQATALDEVGAHEEAQAIIDEVIEENTKAVEVYIPPTETPKVKLEGASIKTYYSANVTSKTKLIRAVAEGRAPESCLDPNMTILNGLARSLKKEMRIDGVEAVSTSSMAATGRK